MSDKEKDEENFYKLSELADFLKGKLPEKKDLKLTPNEPKYSQLMSVMPKFTKMLESGNPGDIDAKVQYDPLTFTALEIIISGDIISFNDPQVFAEITKLADFVEVSSCPSGESEIAFSFENVWNAQPKK